MTRNAAMRLLTLTAALAALLLTIALANAQEPPESRTATRLEPGINRVGWVGEATSVSQLFREIPQLESIWAWDAELDDWIVAGRDAPEGLGWLWRVWAGTGLRLILGGEEPFLWQRSTEPTRGLVELRTGWNLVAWSGADGAPLEQVAKGIGWSLRELRRWNAANQQWTTWISPERSTQLIATSATDQGATDEEAEPITVRRGEALWVNVARSVNWLQPTDILPRLVFPGGASDELQARVRKDLESVLAFFGQQYGIQADPDFTIYVAKDAEALIQAQRNDGYEINDAEAARIRAQWEGTAGQIIRGGLIIRQDLWPEDLAAAQSTIFGDYVITHEYTHILQNQLSHEGGSATWLLEGGAEWAAGERRALSGGESLHDLRGFQQGRLRMFFPSLRSTEAPSGPFYLLGWLAMDRLIQEHGADSWIEIWRRRALTHIGPHGRWESSPNWRTALREVSGVSTSDFYADFAAWQRDQALKNERAGDARTPPPLIQGRVTDSAGVAVAGILVAAVRVEGGDSAGRGESADTAVDGQFVVLAPEAGDYLVSVNVIVDVDDPCTLYYSNGRLIDERDEAQLVTVARSGLQGVDIQLPHNICSRQISRQIKGRVVDTNGEPLAGVVVAADSADHSTRPRRTASDGTFSVALKDKGDYRLIILLGTWASGDCSVYYESSGTTTNFDGASLISVSDANATDILIRVPTGTCAHRIIGNVTKADGEPLADTRISACREVDDRCVEGAGRRTNDNGTFAITVPAVGSYRVSFSLDGCTVYFGRNGLTSNVSDAWLTQVDGRDVQVSQRQVPDGLCSQQISGRLVNAAGEPLVQIYISICQLAGDNCATWLYGRTDADGSFAVTVPAAGAYRLRVSLNGCSIYYRAGSLTTRQAEASRINVTEAESPNLQLRVPEGMCAHRISGRFVDANGAPLVDKTVGACRTGDCGASARTTTDGRFTIRVPSDDSYTFDVWLTDDCYHRLEGRALGSPNNPVRVSGADVTGVELRLPGTVEELCG